jgi:hypothetical protein
MRTCTRDVCFGQGECRARSVEGLLQLAERLGARRDLSDWTAVFVELEFGVLKGRAGGWTQSAIV